MSAEQVAAKVIAKVGLWWPDAEERDLRRAAAAWAELAHALSGVAVRGSEAARAVSTVNRGAGVDSFAGLWARYDGGADRPYLPTTADGARQLATALEDYAQAVKEAKDRIIQLAVTIGATLVAGAALAWFTFGIAAGAAAAVTAKLVALAALVGLQLSTAVASIVAWALVGAVFGAIEAFAVSIAVAQPLRVWAFDDGGFSLDEATDTAAAGGLLGGVFGTGGAGIRAIQSARHVRAARAADIRVAGMVANPKTLARLRELDPDPVHLEKMLQRIPHPPKLREYLERLGPKQLERNMDEIAASGVPQGLTKEQFLATSQRLRELTSFLGDDLQITGSRAVGAATRPHSDLDVMIRVSPERFDEILRTYVDPPPPGSNAERRFMHAVNTGKLDQRVLHIPGLGEAQNSLGSLSGLRKVNIAVIKIGSKFDHGPWIPVP